MPFAFAPTTPPSLTTKAPLRTPSLQVFAEAVDSSQAEKPMTPEMEKVRWERSVNSGADVRAPASPSRAPCAYSVLERYGRPYTGAYTDAFRPPQGRAERQSFHLRGLAIV